MVDQAWYLLMRLYRKRLPRALPFFAPFTHSSECADQVYTFRCECVLGVWRGVTLYGFSTILWSESLASFMDRVLELIGLSSRINSLNLLGLFPKASCPIIRRLHLSPMIATVFSIISIFCALLRP